MATQNINIGVIVSDNGTAKKTVKNFEEIAVAANRAQTAAAGINARPVKSTLAPGGTSGSRMVAATLAPSERMMSGEDYGRARGSAGATGASARDFANQAQGLGGLVRLYATLAANVFAASAAYNALSNAMDTTNLIKGLDMLGAQSGQSLGTLSKRLVEVTDGAISMREAMTATAQASSAGMSGKNIERLAQVAKNASLALGVAMPDALSRLSRGIVKLEPELLDELGLFTKIGPATERYALEVGKSVSALTDFERRQAFANAVLEEGEKKFGALAQAASNPYDKLLATLKNVLQSGGELINKVLGPIIGLLAESPGALAAVIAGLGVVLLKQALPAIGQMRAGLRNTAEEALATSKAFKESFGDEFQARLEQRFKIPDLEASVRKAQADLAKLTVPTNLAPSVQKLASGEDTSAKNIKTVDEILRKKNLTVETGMRGSRKASEAQIEQAKQESIYIKAVIADLKEKQALEAAGTGALGVASKAQGRTDPEVIALQKYQELRGKVDRANAISNAAQNAQIMGVRGSWDLLNKEIAEKGITGLDKYSTQARGALAAIGSRVMGLIGAFSNIGVAIGAAVAAFQLLDSWLTKNGKQAEAFTKALTTADDSVSNVTRTLAAATSIEGFGTRTIANTYAFSNALNELTGSASEVVKLSREADRAAGTWDNFWDSVFSVVDKDRASKLAKTVADQIKSSIKILEREGLADEYKAELKKILNVDSLEDTKKVAEAFKNLSKTQQDAILQLQSNANRALGNASSTLETFKTNTDAALRAQKALANSFVDSNPLFVYGQSLISVSQGLTKVIAAGPDRVIQALEEVATNTEKMGLFGKTFVESFAGISNVFLQQVKNINASRIALIEYQSVLEQTNRVAAAAARTPGAGFAETGGGAAVGRPNRDFSRNVSAQSSASIANSDVREIQRAINAQQDNAIRDAIKLAKDAAKAIYEEGLRYINKAIREAQNAAAITVGRALAVNLTGVQKIEADNALRQQEIKYQLASIDVSERVLDVQDSLVNEMRLANALQAEANILLKNQGKTDDPSIAQNTEATRQVSLARAAARGDTSGLEALDVAQIERRKKDELDLRRKGTQAQRTALGAQSKASNIGVTAQTPGALLAEAEELAKIEERKNASLLARTQILNSISNISNAELTKAKQATELVETEKKQKRELDEIQSKITASTDLKLIAEKQGTEQGKDLAVQYTTQIKKLEEIKKKTQEAQAADTSVILAKNKQEILSDELATIGRRTELERSGAELQNTLTQSRLDTTSQEFALYSSAYEFSRKFVISQQSSLDIQKAQLETGTAIAQAQAGYEQKRLEAVAKINALGEGTDADQRAKDIGDELARQKTLTENTVAGLTAQGAAKTNILEKTREINLEQERYNQLLENSSVLAESLGSVFGDVGSKLGSLADSLTKIAISTEKGSKALEKIGKDADSAWNAGDIDKAIELESEYEKQKKKNNKTELDGNIKAISGAKSLFKEKTFAYKALDKIERAMHIYKMAVFLKETAMDIWATGVSVANSATRTGASIIEAGVDGVKAVVKAISDLPFPLNIAAGAATAAVVAGLLSQIGGSGPSVSGGGFVPTSEQRQETQGTAMGYNSEGAKVQVRRGVFGDVDAKSESIANSLEIIKDNSVAGLSYDNKMLRAFEKLSSALTRASESLFGIPGLRSGTMAGVTEGSRTSGVRGLGGKTTTQEVIDSGIQLKGSFADLSSAAGGAINTFNTVKTTVNRSSFLGLGGGSSSGSNNVYADLAAESPRAAKSIRDAFNFAEEALFEISNLVGVADSVVMEAMQNVPVDELISLRGLSGTEFNEALSAVVGSVLDDAALAIFSTFTEFEQFGEGMLETVTRVTDSNIKVNQALKNLGVDFETQLQSAGVLVERSVTEQVTSIFGLVNKTITETILETSFDPKDIQMESYRITEALIELAGGLDKFLDQTNYFAENFLTEAERLVPVQKSVNAEMSRLAKLGYTSADGLVDTRKEFKALVLSLDLTTESGQEAYQSLMNVQEGFVEVTQTLEDSLTKTIDKFTSFGDNLRSFRDGLVLGNQSILTPLEKYGEAKLQFESTYTKALAGDEDAQSRLTGSAQSFLTASKEYFASSSQYAQDFNSVLDKVGVGITETENQITLAKQQRDLLTSIDANIATIAGVPGLASGGRARGLTLVGEMGPELVDFSYPAQVYPADQTAGMFSPRTNSVSSNMGAVVTELQQLRQEVSQLRKDQQKQTGDLIVSNYDANQKASEEIASAVVGSSQELAWIGRSKSEIK